MSSANATAYNRSYHNDGSGRDTFINHAGASWINPLPEGLFFKSRDVKGDRTAAFEATAEELASDGSTHPYLTGQPGRTLFGKSRYGAVVAQSSGADTVDPALLASANPRVSQAAAQPRTVDGDGADFDPLATALDVVPYDVPHPENRLRQPGHANTGLDGTGGGSTFNGTAEPWTAPKAVDNTYLRLERIYESTCHYGLRTGPFYTDDQAPPHEATLPEKGVNWGKSRYFP